MINNFVPPKPGENILLMCCKCKCMFNGPNPGYGPVLIPVLFVKRAKCPNCGSRKVVPFPGVKY